MPEPCDRILSQVFRRPIGKAFRVGPEANRYLFELGGGVVFAVVERDRWIGLARFRQTDLRRHQILDSENHHVSACLRILGEGERLPYPCDFCIVFGEQFIRFVVR